MSDNSIPIAKKIPHQLIEHGRVREDNYYWLNDRDNEEVIAYLEAENLYSEHILAPTQSLQDTVYQEMVGRIKQDDNSVPYLLRGFWYYTRYEKGKEYPIYCRKESSLENPEQIILDVNKLAQGYEYFHVTGLSVSHDNELLAFGVDSIGRRQYTLYIKNLNTGEIIEKTVSHTDGSYVWANDNLTLFYDVKDEVTLRSYCIKKHRLGSNPQEDIDIFIEKDDTFECGVYKSKSGDYIFIKSYSTLTSETYYLDANNPDGVFVSVLPRERGHLYGVEYYDQHFYLVTNKDAINFKLVRFHVANTGSQDWEEIIAHRDTVLLDGIDIFKEYFVISERENAAINIRVIHWDSKAEQTLQFPDPCYDAYTFANFDFDTKVLRYCYTSFTHPDSVYDYHMDTGEYILQKQDEVVGGYDASQYISERIFARAEDGTQIPISLVYNRSKLKNKKNNPLLLYGYGSYGISMDAYFSSDRLSLLDRGFIFAIAHIRGGQEMGRRWYEHGKLLHKMNTFTDFIACAEYLVNQNYTSPQHLYAMGGSAGGLLMGAVINMRPDLFHGIVAQVPFVDVMTTMGDETIPLTTGEFDEWGNPKDKTYYDYMMQYSPYDNIKKQDYPHMLVTTGLHDSQVQYWEPAKWVAKLREYKTDDNMLLFRCEMNAGHGGKSGRFQRLRERALEYAFLLSLEMAIE